VPIAPARSYFAQLNHVQDVLSALREFSRDDLPNYSDCVRIAFERVDPVFTRRQYGDFFFHCASTVPGWLSRVVMANADTESQGSQKLFWLWRGAASNAEISKDVLVHAKDEARHSQLFVSLIAEAFPDFSSAAVLNDKRAELFRITPQCLTEQRFSMPEEHLMDHLVQMNMGEIRTRIHMLMLAPVIYAFTPVEAKKRVAQVLRGLVTDEIRHINYTARFIESWCTNGDRNRITYLFSERLNDFHRFTIEQTESSVRAYGSGRYPNLLEV
jgi:hypothetical protein